MPVLQVVRLQAPISSFGIQIQALTRPYARLVSTKRRSSFTVPSQSVFDMRCVCLYACVCRALQLGVNINVQLFMINLMVSVCQ